MSKGYVTSQTEFQIWLQKANFVFSGTLTLIQGGNISTKNRYVFRMTFLQKEVLQESFPVGKNKIFFAWMLLADDA